MMIRAVVIIMKKTFREALAESAETAIILWVLAAQRPITTLYSHIPPTSIFFFLPVAFDVVLPE